MHPLQKQFHDEILEKQLFKADEKILLAVSGGVDSMVLAHLFLSSEFPFGIAHCNFGLRGRESEADEELVRAWAESYDIEFYVKQFEISGSIQLAARQARYKWFDKLIAEHEFDYIATAHHLNDSLETTLLNLSRGTGIKGLSGISLKSEKVIRPLLFASKNQLMDYAKEQNITWREDASNSKNDYNRNLMRNQVVPLLKELNASLDDTFKNTVERLHLTNKMFEQRVDEIKKEFLSKQDEVWKLDTSWVKEQTDMLLLSEIMSDYGFNYVTSKLTYSALSKSGKSFLSENYQLTIDRECVFISVLNKEEKKVISIDGEGDYTIGRMNLQVSKVNRSEVVFDENKSRVFLDSSKMDFPLKVRNWKEGDRFNPLGMSRSKKVSDYLIDKKVPLTFKPNVKVLMSGKEIVWLMGYQISDDCKLNKQTQSVLRLEMT